MSSAITPENLAAKKKPGNLELKTFVRTPFPVKAVQITPENITDVTAWCGGTLVSDPEVGQYIQVDVRNTLNENQSKASVGDWILMSETKRGDSWKVYRPVAMVRNFTEVRNDKLAVVFVNTP